MSRIYKALHESTSIAIYDASSSFPLTLSCPALAWYKNKQILDGINYLFYAVTQAFAAAAACLPAHRRRRLFFVLVSCLLAS